MEVSTCPSSNPRSALVAVAVALDRSPSQLSAQAQARASERCPPPPRSLIPLQTRLRYTTMIVLPEGEEILDVICGDKDFWVISATQNIAHVKPAKEGAATNLNLVTASGAVYSFLLTREERQRNAGPEGLRQRRSECTRMASRSTTAPRRSRSSRRELTRSAGRGRGAQPARDRSRSPPTSSSIPRRCSSSTARPKYEKPFLVRSIWHDGQFTYIKADATELPALYEVKDGQPALVNFQVHDGTYVVPKVLERGYWRSARSASPSAAGAVSHGRDSSYQSNVPCRSRDHRPVPRASCRAVCRRG